MVTWPMKICAVELEVSRFVDERVKDDLPNSCRYLISCLRRPQDELQSLPSN